MERTERCVCSVCCCQSNTEYRNKRRRMGNMVFPEREQMTDTSHPRTRTHTCDRFLVCVTLATNTSAHPCTVAIELFMKRFIEFFFSSFSSDRPVCRALDAHTHLFLSFFFFFQLGLLAHTFLFILYFFSPSSWSSTLRLVLFGTNRMERRQKSNAFLLFILYYVTETDRQRPMAWAEWRQSEHSEI